MHIHLDIVGGIAGDMFCAAMLDAFPELEKPLYDFLSPLPIFQKYTFALEQKKQKEITGKQFHILANSRPINDKNHFVFKPLTSVSQNVVLTAQATHHHEHYSWQDIQVKLKQISTHDEIYQCAKEIYTILASAESEIHGIELEMISLHEVGADDAILDILSAAFLIHHSHVLSWSCSPLPWGQGVIKCAHGELPVPAPATLKILGGFEWSHDDEVGERITPTGAAILAWIIKHHAGRLSGTFIKNGYGCGNRQFKYKPNILRLNVFATYQKQSRLQHDAVYIVQCDIDDMTQESLAIAQTKLRQQSGVIDLTSYSIMGKKGRWMTRVELLCVEDKLTDICHSILLETSTLGVRYWQTERIKLSREHLTVYAKQDEWPVKVAFRPDGSMTAKLESDAVQELSQTYRERQKIKNEIEQLAIDDYLTSSKIEPDE